MKTACTPGRASAADASMAHDARPRVRAADEAGVQHARPGDVVDEGARAGQQPGVLDPLHAAAGITGRTERGGGSSDHQRKLLPAAHGRGVLQLGRVPVDLPGRPALEYLLKRDPALKPGQGRAEAVMRAEDEGQVHVLLAVDVERVRVVEAPGITVGRAHHAQQRAARGHRLPVPLDVPRHVAGVERAGRLAPQHLLDRAGDQRPVGGELRPLPGVLGEGRGHPADEPAGRLVPAPADDRDVHQDLVAGQRAGDAVLVLELGVDQLGHHVVRRVGVPPVDVLAHRLVREDDLLAEVDLAAVRGQDLGVGLVAEGDLPFLGDADQHADDLHRHLQAQLLDEVEPGLADQRVQAGGAVLAHQRLELGDPARREHPGEQLPVDVVDRRVLHDEGARRDLHVRLDQLEHDAAGGGVRLGVRQHPLHVGVAADRVEVMRLVVVEGGFLAHPVEQRPRVGREAGVVRVPVEAIGVHAGSPPVVG